MATLRFIYGNTYDDISHHFAEKLQKNDILAINDNFLKCLTSGLINSHVKDIYSSIIERIRGYVPTKFYSHNGNWYVKERVWEFTSTGSPVQELIIHIYPMLTELS